MRRVVLNLFGAGALLFGCSSEPEAPHGSPVLLAAFWNAAGTRVQIYGGDADAGTAPVPGGANEVDFVFDRRLDGARIEDVVGGVTVPKANPPITVDWPDMAAGPPFSYQVFYNSTSAFGPRTAYAYLRPRLPGFPSATEVTFHLNHNGLTSAYGEPMIGPTEISARTDPMTILPRAGASTDALEPVPANYRLPVRFSNRPGAPNLLAPLTRARAGGIELPTALAADSSDPTVIYVAPAACLGGWPAGATIDVTFDPGLPDAFGVLTTGDLTAGSFLVTGTPPDPDAGATVGDAATCD